MDLRVMAAAATTEFSGTPCRLSLSLGERAGVRASFLCFLIYLLWTAVATANTAPGPDAFGYTAAATTNFSLLQITNGSTRVLWFDDDTAVTNISLGFNFNFYGTSYSNVSFNVN